MKQVTEKKEEINKIEFQLNKPGPPAMIPNVPVNREVLKKIKILKP